MCPLSRRRRRRASANSRNPIGSSLFSRQASRLRYTKDVEAPTCDRCGRTCNACDLYDPEDGETAYDGEAICSECWAIASHVLHEIDCASGCSCFADHGEAIAEAEREKAERTRRSAAARLGWARRRDRATEGSDGAANRGVFAMSEATRKAQAREIAAGLRHCVACDDVGLIGMAMRPCTSCGGLPDYLPAVRGLGHVVATPGTHSISDAIRDHLVALGLIQTDLQYGDSPTDLGRAVAQELQTLRTTGPWD